MKKLYTILFILCLTTLAVLSQNPTHYPTPGTEPVNFNTTKVIFYIVVPILLIGGFWWMSRNRKKRNEDAEN